MVMPAASCFLFEPASGERQTCRVRRAGNNFISNNEGRRRLLAAAAYGVVACGVRADDMAAGAEADQAAVRLRELRWKNRAWLATAETIAGWNGLEIRKAGSGRSPVRKRSG